MEIFNGSEKEVIMEVELQLLQIGVGAFNIDKNINTKNYCVLFYYHICMFYYVLGYYISTYFLSPLKYPTSLFLLSVIVMLHAILPSR